MSNRKLCPKWGLECGGENRTRGRKGCPRNANSDCLITEPKYKRVKAWAAFYKQTNQIAGLFGEKKCKVTTHLGMKQFPCTILIDHKYLGGKK